MCVCVRIRRRPRGCALEVRAWCVRAGGYDAARGMLRCGRVRPGWRVRSALASGLGWRRWGVWPQYRASRLGRGGVRVSVCLCVWALRDGPEQDARLGVHESVRGSASVGRFESAWSRTRRAASMCASTCVPSRRPRDEHGSAFVPEEEFLLGGWRCRLVSRAAATRSGARAGVGASVSASECCRRGHVGSRACRA